MDTNSTGVDRQAHNSCSPHVVVWNSTASCEHAVRLMFLLFSILSVTLMATVRPPKRRKTGRRPAPMVDGGDTSLDAAMYIYSEGGKRDLVPVRPEVSAESQMETEPALGPDPEYNQEFHQPTDQEMVDVDYRRNPPKNRYFYMKEFVARADGILQAMQAREGLPDSTICANCSDSIGRWRCDDCIGATLLCRFCMRHSHFSNPFHRIQCWTGTHFRKAALWEVGVYLTLPHQKDGICANIAWQKQMLEQFQKNKDMTISRTTDELIAREASLRAEPATDPVREKAQDEAAMHFLDQLWAGQNPEEFSEEDENDLVDVDADIQDVDAGTAGFTSYMNDRIAPDPMQSQYGIPIAPNCDGLNNQYIRIVHTNGIHHIALVCCTCQGPDAITTDLIYAGWVPTSFVRVRTIFTTAVLDHFRYCNLEMRSSAYEFYQLLRRVTNSLSPSKVANLYHELRRLSRLWRWVKKLRWAGYAQRVGQPITPKSGELGIFCPACPQVGINLPDDWKLDPNRWVFRRVVTADGNFKADHVRQKHPADDIWLSDGLGMTTKNSEYKRFLETAWDRSTVSVIKADCLE